MLHMGGGPSKKTSFRTFRGFMSQSGKMKGLPNCAKGGGGRGAENAEPKERKDC